MNAPVVVFAYNRKDHLEKTIQALERTILAQNTRVYIFSDAAKDSKNEDKVSEVREYLRELENRHQFEFLEVYEAEQNKGLSKSIIEGVTRIINEFGRVIVLEDDILVAEDFLLYMNQALNFYEKEPKAWAISGYAENFEFLNAYPYQTFAHWRADCWGWATWSNRWNMIDWTVSDYRKFCFSFKRRHLFNQGGEDLARMLDAQMVGAINSWAIRWCYAAYTNNMLTIHPTKSRTTNIGLDGSGEHCKGDGTVRTLPDIKENICIMVPCVPDDLLSKNYTKYLNKRYTLWHRLRKKIKSLVRRIRYIFFFYIQR